jgi:hypothetical protein
MYKLITALHYIGIAIQTLLILTLGIIVLYLPISMFVAILK